MPSFVPIARVIRSGLVEAVHEGAVAVVDQTGRVLASAGDPEAVTFARSSIKPLQAAASLDAAGEDLPDAETAVMSASHNGEPVHVRAVQSILERAGLDPEALRCPPAFPMDPGTRVEDPDPMFRDCSGKHAGMLLASARRGWDLETYLDPAHPIQVAVLERLGLATGREPESMGVDGCGTPVPAYPLSALALAFARLGTLAPRPSAAMQREPYMVAGRDRPCTDLMSAVPGLVAKVGAEGLLCLSLPEQGLGVAIKCADGSSRARPPVAIAVLRYLGVQAGHHSLERWARPPVLGGGVKVGEIEPTLELRSH